MEAVGTPPGAVAAPQSQGSSSGQFPSWVLHHQPHKVKNSRDSYSSRWHSDHDNRDECCHYDSSSRRHARQSQSMDVSQPSEQMDQEAESQPADQHPSQETASVGVSLAEPINHTSGRSSRGITSGRNVRS